MAIQTVKTGAAVNDGTGDDARTAFTKINNNFTDNTHAASRLVGTAASNVMEVGAFGLGGNATESITSADHFNNKLVTQKGSLKFLSRLCGGELAKKFGKQFRLFLSRLCGGE
mgnify:CR=1 FL=1